MVLQAVSESSSNIATLPSKKLTDIGLKMLKKYDPEYNMLEVELLKSAAGGYHTDGVPRSRVTRLIPQLPLNYSALRQSVASC